MEVVSSTSLPFSSHWYEKPVNPLLTNTSATKPRKNKTAKGVSKEGDWAGRDQRPHPAERNAVCVYDMLGVLYSNSWGGGAGSQDGDESTALRTGAALVSQKRSQHGEVTVARPGAGKCRHGLSPRRPRRTAQFGLANTKKTPTPPAPFHTPLASPLPDTTSYAARHTRLRAI